MVKHNYQQIGETLYEEHLDNGLGIFVFPKPEFGKYYAFFATRYGGMDTRFQVDGQWLDTPMGIAHYLEHKMFDTPDGGNALQTLSATGASPNAFTSTAITGYHFECTDGFWENLRTLLEFVSVPYFTKESVEKEQGIIGQEIRMIEDQPGWQAYHLLLEALYHHHPVRNSVAGTVESIAQITAETLYQCHGAFYTPANMVLCVAGDVDPERVCALARKILPQQAKPPISRDCGAAEPETVFRREDSRAMAVSAPLLQLGIKGTPAPSWPWGRRIGGNGAPARQARPFSADCWQAVPAPSTGSCMTRASSTAASIWAIWIIPAVRSCWLEARAKNRQRYGMPSWRRGHASPGRAWTTVCSNG